MAQQILNDGSKFGVQRNKINDNFTELFAMLNNITQLLNETNAAVTALQAEATAKWVLLNNVDNRSRSNENRITAIENL